MHGDLALILDAQRLPLTIGDLCGQATGSLCDGQVGPEGLHGLRVDEGCVDGAGRELAIEHLQHFDGDVDGNTLLRFQGGSAEVGRHDNLGMPCKRIMGGGFGAEDVEGGACEVAGVEGGDQCHLINQADASRIDQSGAGLEGRELFGAQQRRRAGGERRVEGEEIDGGKQLVESDEFNAE